MEAAREKYCRTHLPVLFKEVAADEEVRTPETRYARMAKVVLSLSIFHLGARRTKSTVRRWIPRTHYADGSGPFA